ncbi:MAG: DUF4830 domain-containing protein [Ruminococcaceae bacterium]|nr:DUF4830 domain-containing protein [Oscillospiraceae bacterium]
MVLSLKANKKRILAVVVLIGIVILGILVMPNLVNEPLKFKGGTHAERAAFLESFGYEISEDPVDVRTVTIPKEFSDIYTEYNDMQKAQGFDLKPYKGKECKQYIYLITNYPNTDCEVHATMLVYQNIIIGGDVSSAEINGFMHGFALDSAHFSQSEENKTIAENKTAEKENETAAGKGNKETENEAQNTAYVETGEGEDIFPTD